jgi:predicted Zn-dependent peptidase
VTDASVPLGRVYLAYPIPPFGGVEWDALEVAADLLARGRGARLYAGLVRRRLAHEVAARTDPLVGDPARLTIQATAPPHVREEELTAAVMDEVDRLAREGPSEDELERVRNLRRTEFAASMERAGERADRIAMYSSLLADAERVNHEIERYLAVDRRAVRKMTAKFLGPDRATMLVNRPMRSA